MIKRLLKQMNIKGVFLDETIRFELELPWDLASWVTIDEGADYTLTHSVSSNVFRTTIEAFEILIQKGYQKIFARQVPEKVKSYANSLQDTQSQKRKPKHSIFRNNIDDSINTLESDSSAEVIISTYPELGKQISRTLNIPDWATLSVNEETSTKAIPPQACTANMKTAQTQHST